MNRVVSGNRLHSNVSRHCFGLWKMNEYFGGNSEELFDIIFHSKHEHSHHRSVLSVSQKSTSGLIQFSSVIQSCPTLCNPVDCHTPGLCPSPTPRVYSNSCLLSQWCHPTISSSVVPFSSCPQSFPASGSFPMSQLFASGGQSTGVSASVNIQGWFPLGLTGLISQSKALSRVFSSTTLQKYQFFGNQPSLWSNPHIYTWLLEKP